MASTVLKIICTEFEKRLNEDGFSWIHAKHKPHFWIDRAIEATQYKEQETVTKKYHNSSDRARNMKRWAEDNVSAPSSYIASYIAHNKL